MDSQSSPLGPARAPDGSQSECCTMCDQGVFLLNAAAVVMMSNAQVSSELANLHVALGRMSTVPSPALDAQPSDPGVSLLKAAAAVMISNAKVSTELANLHAALGRMSAVPLSASILTSSHLPTEQPTATALAGSGAGSPEAYKIMMEKHTHGMLGRAHISDIDRMSDSARSELDQYLRRVIHKTVPSGGTHNHINPDIVFATLSSFGLTLENRGQLADATVLNDSHAIKTISRLQNYVRYYSTAKTNNFESYWNASAMETLVELARYRDLFTAEGYLKEV